MATAIYSLAPFIGPAVGPIGELYCLFDLYESG
jgi:hypothetical protein